MWQEVAQGCTTNRLPCRVVAIEQCRRVPASDAEWPVGAWQCPGLPAAAAGILPAGTGLLATRGQHRYARDDCWWRQCSASNRCAWASPACDQTSLHDLLPLESIALPGCPPVHPAYHLHYVWPYVLKVTPHLQKDVNNTLYVLLALTVVVRSAWRAAAGV